MRKILISLALLSMVATNANAGGWHGHEGGAYHGHAGVGYYGHGGGGYRGYGGWGYHGGAGYFSLFAIPFVAAALTYPYWANPGPYYYTGPTVYVPSPPSYVVANAPPADYAIASSSRGVVTQSSGNGVIELGPVDAVQSPGSSASQPPSEQWFVYPSKGQSPQQQANDRRECGKWATTQSGYDPELRSHRRPDTGPADYARALSACFEGRGYAVR
jgi:hypothetical protein